MTNRATYTGHARRAIWPTWSLRSLKDNLKKRSFRLLAIWSSSARCCRFFSLVYPLPATPTATTRDTCFKAVEVIRNLLASSSFVSPSVRTIQTWGEIRQTWLALKDLTRTLLVTLPFRFRFFFIFSCVFFPFFVYCFSSRLIEFKFWKIICKLKLCCKLKTN